MARAERRLPTNVPGPLFVDDTCIDCGTCWEVAPTVFAEDPTGRSHVVRQPEGDAERARAFMALVACPTSSIGTEERDAAAAALREASRAFPEQVAPGVHYCGYASPRSFGASSWLITRPRGNVLVDSPRAAAPLLARLEALGGVARMILTHRDDVADHARFRERFGCERVLHEADVEDDTRDVERRIAGHAPVPLDDDLLVVPVPGHTAGSIALLHEETYLFTGDHLWGEGEHLTASRAVCWSSWSEQLRSLERLLDLRFEWVLPGHGGRFRASSPAAMRRELERLLRALRRAA